MEDITASNIQRTIMKIFLIWSCPELETSNLLSEFKNNGHQVVYWLGDSADEKYKDSGMIFHYYQDAALNKPAQGFSIENFPTPSKELIEKLYKTESIILTMMNNKYSSMLVDQRRHFYYTSLRYWHGILLQFKPETIFFDSIPHGVCEYIIYELAKLLNIKTLIIDSTWISDRSYIYSNFRSSALAFNRQMEQYQGKNFTVADLEIDLQNYYHQQTDPSVDSTPFYMPMQYSLYLGKALFKRRFEHLINILKNHTLLKTAVEWLIKTIGPNLKKDYVRLQNKPDLTRHYIYAPLHFQPEMTTSPRGDIYVDQILLLETLSNALPKDWVIYVKEHPIEWLYRGLGYYNSRYKNYYQKIASLKNVRLVPVNFSSIQLISHAQAVSTVTGMAAWEGVLRSKPGLVFGYPWYRDCEGIFMVTSPAECQAVFKKIMDGYKIDKQKVINFLYCFDKSSIHGYIDIDIEKNASLNLTREESARNIRRAIIKELTNQN